MPHLEHDQLVFLALGEQAEAGTGAADHTASCEQCSAELATLRRLVSVSAETQDIGELPPPPERVWDGIVADVQAAEALPAPDFRPHRTPDVVVPFEPPADAPGHTGTGPVSLDDRRRRRWPRWATTVVAAVAAAAIAVGVTLAATWQRDTTPDVVASVPLTAYGTTPRTAHGDAQLLADGEMRLTVDNLPPAPGYYEVWLINPNDLTDMISVGVLGRDTQARMALPSTVDLSKYKVIDISAEAYDGNPKHSGDSLLRGELT